MGTRSTIKFYSEWDDKAVLLSVYQQYDGYISGVGHDLARWLLDKKIVNGFGGTEITRANGYANGMGCLAAQFVADMKGGIGGFYMTTPKDKQEYNYEVRYNENLIIKVRNWNNRIIFEGTPQQLLAYDEE